MLKSFNSVMIAVALFFLASYSYSQETAVGNAFQMAELGMNLPETTTDAEPTVAAASAESISTLTPRDSGPALAPDFINFGYLQSTTILPYMHYEAYTHLAPPFVNFNSNGDLTAASVNGFTDRNSALKLNGAADRAGTKIIACVRNEGFNTAVLSTVMQNATLRNKLAGQVANLVQNDPYCHGVNFDFEPSWNTTTRNGITAFLQQMRSVLPAPYEISVYVHPTYSTTYWGNMPQIIDYVDYVQYSTYDYGTSYAHANSDYNNCLAQAKLYMDNGVPPEKLILTWASYGRRWEGISAYNQDGESGAVSQGFYDGFFNTTLRQANNGPFTSNYVTGDEIGWHTYTNSGIPYTVVHETPESLEIKIAAALSFPIASSYEGKRLAGVGWWSVMWNANYNQGFDSYDLITAAVVNRPLYYRHIDLLVQELLKNKGQSAFNLESFETNNQHWRDPNESPDTIAASTTVFDQQIAPAGAGKPAGSIHAQRLFFNFASIGSRAFARFEMLNHPTYTAITDTNATLAPVSKNTRFSGHYYVSGNYSTRQLRLALVDGSRQVEVSDPIQLPSTIGWHTFTWDINDPAQINAWNTNEPALLDGNGVVNTSGPDARDISFLGFIVDGGASGSGTIYFDELTYEHNVPADKKYVINEYRYDNNAAEFVEIAGPPGPFPSDLQLISYNPAYVPGSTALTREITSLAGKTMPASGIYVVGDSGVPNAAGSTGFVPGNWSIAADDVYNGSPGALQLYGSTSGIVYDSVVYEAFGGLDNLTRAQARSVTGEGYGWSGEAGPGLAGNGQPYSLGRMADGADTNHNQTDFSFMPPTPGQPNGATGLLNTTQDFTTIPPSAFQTYQSISLVNPAAHSIPASPSGGNVYRCVDTSGGGVIGVFGDGAMGAETGIDITGEIFIPAGAHPTQAVAVGFCGTQGSTFFSASPASTGYEDGYWLIYENGTNGLADGRPDHHGQFEFVHATNDNMDSIISAPLGTKKTLANTQISAGTWTTFHLRLDPLAAVGQQLVAQINNIDVYRGPIPAGGPTKGAFTVGFREGQGGAVAAVEGTFIDNLTITRANPPTRVENYYLY